jgi:hypothetical protein
MTAVFGTFLVDSVENQLLNFLPLAALAGCIRSHFGSSFILGTFHSIAGFAFGRIGSCFLDLGFFLASRWI